MLVGLGIVRSGDSVGEVGDAVTFADRRRLEFDRCACQVFEEPDPVALEHWDEAHLQPVDQFEVEALLGDLRAAEATSLASASVLACSIALSIPRC